MELNSIITAIISSSVIATILSSIINYYIKQQDFKNEYYKKLIEKRINAYEWLENQIGILKTSILDTSDGLPYHQIFSLGEDFYLKSTHSITLANTNNLWINSETHEKFTELMHIFNRLNFEIDTSNSNDLINAGKKYYREIGQLRDDLENLTRNDILTLYDFKNIKKKTSTTNFNQEIRVK